MKSEIHPTYAPIVFRDLASGEMFLTRSTATSEKTVSLDGVEYPVIDVEISSASHPFYTGQKTFIDTAGRVERFQRKFAGDYFKKDGDKKAAAPAPAKK
jgi:large subunit ribosomal protein L31